MPKIIVREYDNSTTGLATSANFAVVVPGFVGTPDAGYDPVDKFDINGVAEFKSQAEFKKYIGLVPAGLVARTAAIPYIKNTDPGLASLESWSIVATEARSTHTEIKTVDSADSTKILTLIKYVESRKQLCYYKYDETAEKLVLIGGVFKAVADETITNYGYLKTIVTDTVEGVSTQVKYAFTGVTSLNDTDVFENNTSTADQPIIDPTTGEAYYLKNILGPAVVIPFNKLGCDGVSALDNHYGNQIAYELLGLGYTVLYKKLNSNGTKSSTDQLNEADFWEPLKDKSIYNFRYLVSGGCYDSGVANKMINIANFNNTVTIEDAETYGDANGRGDCIALCDVDETDILGKVKTVEVLNAFKTAVNAINGGKYAAIFAPRVIYSMGAAEVAPFGDNKTFPASFHYLACAANSMSRYAEWYAVAGYNRGVSARGVAATTIKLGEIAINTLAPRVTNNYATKAVNLILNERGNYYMWGNRTAETLNASGLKFSHFLNIRQLCTTIKKDLYTACRQFTFDPNSDLLWTSFVSAISQTLEKMQGDQGIKGYKITKVKNNKKALLTARIRIVPIEAVEDFDISIYLEDNLTGITVSSDETE